MTLGPSPWWRTSPHSSAPTPRVSQHPSMDACVSDITCLGMSTVHIVAAHLGRGSVDGQDVSIKAQSQTAGVSWLFVLDQASSTETALSWTKCQVWLIKLCLGSSPNDHCCDVARISHSICCRQGPGLFAAAAVQALPSSMSHMMSAHHPSQILSSSSAAWTPPLP